MYTFKHRVINLYIFNIFVHIRGASGQGQENGMSGTLTYCIGIGIFGSVEI